MSSNSQQTVVSSIPSGKIGDLSSKITQAGLGVLHFSKPTLRVKGTDACILATGSPHANITEMVAYAPRDRLGDNLVTTDLRGGG